MRYVRYAKINGARWKFVWKSYLGHNSNGKEFLGRCVYDTREIHIKKGMSNALTAEVIAHEVDHAQNPKHEEDAVEVDTTELINILDRVGLIADDE